MKDLPKLGTPEDLIEEKPFEDVILTKVEEGENYYTVYVDSSVFGIPKVDGHMPWVGDRVRLWPGGGLGVRIRGIALRGTVLTYVTEEEARKADMRQRAEAITREKAAYERGGKAEQEKRYKKLPAAFKKRLDKYRRNNKDFGWKYESYELFCCEQAVVFCERAEEQVEHARNGLEVEVYWDAKGDPPESLEAQWLLWWNSLDFDRQNELMPRLSGEHSGNTFATAVRLAVLWYVHGEKGVVGQFGALAPLVGSEAYGDVPVDG